MTDLILKEENSLIKAHQFEGEVQCEILNIDSNIENIDVWMDEYVKKYLSESLNSVFIPTCFGQTKSDFLGLRLAMHVRTTENLSSQLSNIILYGPETLEEIIKYGGELYQLIKTNGVDFVDLGKGDISVKLGKKPLLNGKDNLREELKKISLSVPKDYFDSHSIANLWGAFRLSKVAGIELEDLPSLQRKKEKLASIYFKWLMVINDATGIRNEEVVKTERASNKRLKGLNIKGTINLDELPIK